MLRLSSGLWEGLCFLLLLVSLAASSALAQLETATVSGQVVDPSGLSITGAQVKLVDIDRDTTTERDHQQFWPVHVSERSARALPNGSHSRRLQDSQCHGSDRERPGPPRAEFQASSWLCF